MAWLFMEHYKCEINALPPSHTFSSFFCSFSLSGTHTHTHSGFSSKQIIILLIYTNSHRYTEYTTTYINIYMHRMFLMNNRCFDITALKNAFCLHNINRYRALRSRSRFPFKKCRLRIHFTSVSVYHSL